jgi:hypothetical protein
MKKTSLLLISIIMLSCSKDEEQPIQIVEQNIYGKWYYKEVVVNNATIPYDDHETCGKDYIEFYDQNKIKSIDVWSCQEDVEWIGTFTKSNNNLTISNGSESRTVEIIELNTNSLIYQYDYDDDIDGTNEHYVEKFTRQ